MKEDDRLTQGRESADSERGIGRKVREADWTQSAVSAEEIDPALFPLVEELGIIENCRELAQEGWTVLENAVDPAFVSELRSVILETEDSEALRLGGSVMELGKHPVYADTLVHPKVFTLAKFSVGQGCLLYTQAISVRGKGSPALDLHCDQVMFPVPLPEPNMLLTACWVLDEFSEEGGATCVLPGSGNHRRPPTPEDDLTGAKPVECPAGSIILWDGRVWHGNCPRTIAGDRVVVHNSYCRLVMRPGIDYSAHADELIQAHGAPMSQLLGRDDVLFLDYQENDPERLIRTVINATT